MQRKQPSNKTRSFPIEHFGIQWSGRCNRSVKREVMIDNEEPPTENRALKRIVSLISSEKAVRMGTRGVAYFAAAATVYLIAGGDISALVTTSPVLARLIESIGADTLASILEKVGHIGEESPSTEETLKQIEDALVNFDLEAILTEREFYRAIRVLQQQDNLRYQELSHHVLYIMDSLDRMRPGDPSPLSLLPRSARPQPTSAPLVGRDNDLSWLRKSLGDRMLIGQPGVGKTSVLFHLAIEGNGRFALSRDRGEIAAALVEEQPSIVVVDDAHRVPDFLLELRQLREETGIAFDIVASTWPSSKEVISENLAIGESKKHELALLTRDEMVEVITSAGLIGPDELIREIVNQAVGRPGLARTLTQLCLDNSVQDLFSGDALRRSAIKILDDLALQRNIRLMLATLSFAGDIGMELRDAERLLGMRVFEMWSPLDYLAGSGIIYYTAPGRISVRPAALREALVGEVFFGGMSPMSAREMIIQVPELMPSIALTLVGSRSRGGAVPDQLLIEVLEAGSSVDAWKHYAGLGKDEAKRVLSLRPNLIVSVAYPVLYHVPELAIPMLLNTAIGDDRPVNSNPNHPLRLLGGWVKSARPGSGEAVTRRQKLLKVTLGWLDAGRDVDVGLQAVQYALLPGFEFISTDPGSGMTLQCTSGH